MWKVFLAYSIPKTMDQCFGDQAAMCIRDHSRNFLFGLKSHKLANIWHIYLWLGVEISGLRIGACSYLLPTSTGFRGPTFYFPTFRDPTYFLWVDPPLFSWRFISLFIFISNKIQQLVLLTRTKVPNFDGLSTTTTWPRSQYWRNYMIMTYDSLVCPGVPVPQPQNRCGRAFLKETFTWRNLHYTLWSKWIIWKKTQPLNANLL